MDGLSIDMSWENLRINIKDVLQIVSFVVVAAFFFSAQSSKIEAIAETVKEIKVDNKESSTESKLSNQTLINQVNANTLQIKLLEQDVQMLKESRKR
jgi:hypothetical protein